MQFSGSIMVPGGPKMGSVILDLAFFLLQFFDPYVFWSAGGGPPDRGLRGSRGCQPPPPMCQPMLFTAQENNTIFYNYFFRFRAEIFPLCLNTTYSPCWIQMNFPEA